MGVIQLHAAGALDAVAPDELPGNRFIVIGVSGHQVRATLAGTGADCDGASGQVISWGGTPAAPFRMVRDGYLATLGAIAQVSAAEPIAAGDPIAVGPEGRAVKAHGRAVVVAYALSAVRQEDLEREAVVIKWASGRRARCAAAHDAAPAAGEG